MTAEVHAFPDEAGPAGRFADALGLPLTLIRPHVFPDGESRPVVMATNLPRFCKAWTILSLCLGETRA